MIACTHRRAAAKESIGGALAVAQQVAQNPLGGPPAAQSLVTAANDAFAQAVAHTSLIGGIILAAGTVLVAVILPGRRRAAPTEPDRAIAESLTTRDEELMISSVVRR